MTNYVCLLGDQTNDIYLLFLKENKIKARVYHKIISYYLSVQIDYEKETIRFGGNKQDGFIQLYEFSKEKHRMFGIIQTCEISADDQIRD